MPPKVEKEKVLNLDEENSDLDKPEELDFSFKQSLNEGDSSDDNEDEVDCTTPSEREQTPSVSISPSTSQGISVVSSLTELFPLGKFEALIETDPMFQIIRKYAKNSSGIPPSYLKVHTIFKHKPSKLSYFSLPTVFSKYEMLLWCKTTPSSVQNLAKGGNRCIAFYDRLTRAFGVRPETLTKSLRHTILLYSVNLGTVHKSDKGYSYWSSEGLQNEFNSVKGMGGLCPDWNQNEKDGSIIVPSGPTKESNQVAVANVSPTFDYSEYMVFESGRATLKYAVDLEIHPINK